MIDQHAQELYGAGTVGQYVVYLEVDPAAIIGHIKQQRGFVLFVQRAARRLIFGMNHRPLIGGLQIIPEQPMLEHTEKTRKFFERAVERLLKNRLLHRPDQFAGKAEHFGVPLTAGGGKYFGRVVQPAPLSVFFLLMRFHFCGTSLKNRWICR